MKIAAHQFAVPRPNVQRPAAGIFATLAGLLVHSALLILPVLVLGGRQAVTMSAVMLLLIVSVWVVAESHLQHCRSSCPSPHPHDRAARRWAAINGALLLLILWIGLLTAGHPTAVGIVAGSIAMLAGITLRGAAVARLSRHFRTEIVVARGQPLVCDGIYAWVRHPSETGLLLFVLGSCMLLHSPAALAVGMFALLPLMLYRIELEEARLREEFSTSYKCYAQRVRRLVPLVY